MGNLKIFFMNVGVGPVGSLFSRWNLPRCRRELEVRLGWRHTCTSHTSPCQCWSLKHEYNNSTPLQPSKITSSCVEHSSNKWYGHKQNTSQIQIQGRMQSVKSFIWGPTPEEQKRKCNALVRKNVRSLDRDIQNLRALEGKTKTFILQASKRAEKNPSGAKQAAQETRIFARELIRVRKQSGRLQTSKAQLQSVAMQVNEAFSVRKIEGSIRASTGIMKDVNSLVRLPELTGTMRELSQELVKAGIIEEMVGDSLPDNELLEGEDEEAESEVDKILSEVLKDKLPPSAAAKVDELPSAPTAAEEVEDEDQEEMLAQMRGRLEALKS
ncbi:Snf7-domain-containing protein [Tothia fuscella]|uniref:Snf7-domain-containing protein n=1 Tax=Tothia fuscella TaxID=1048955 RepID=A0A9P4TSM3_9PEZI|nr:Snf7-domain-containing protein [Tothia fuscella]